MAPVVVPGIDVPLLTGPIVLGYMWSYCLYGMLIVQLYFYSEMFPNDGRAIKTLVWSMFMLETIFTVFSTIGAWNQYGTGWGDVDTLLFLDWSWVPLPIINSVVAAVAQSFYIWRIWCLTSTWWLPPLIGSVIVTHVTVSFYYCIIITIRGRGIGELTAVTPEVAIWLAGSATCDVIITISLIVILSFQKRRTTFQRTRGIMNKLIRFSVETGSVTTAVALIDLILWLTCRQWNLHFILYSNMLMATLNCRAPLFRSEAVGTTTMIQSSFWAQPAAKGAKQSSVDSRPAVHVSQTTNITSDRTETIVMSDFGATADPDSDGKGSLSNKGYPQLVA